MFRFATEFASAKFRLLSRCRAEPLAHPPPPISEVRHPGLSSTLQSFQVTGTENDPQVFPSASAAHSRPGGPTDWTGKTVARKLNMDGRGDNEPSKGQKELKAFGTNFIKRLRRSPKVAPLATREVNTRQQSTRGSQESPLICKGHEDTGELKPVYMDVKPAGQTDKQTEEKVKKFPIRAGIGKLMRIFHRQRVVAVNVIPKRGHATPAPEGSGLLNIEQQNDCQAHSIKTHSDHKHKDEGVFDPHGDCYSNTVESGTSSRSSLKDKFTTKTQVLPSLTVTLNKEWIDGEDAEITDNNCQGDLQSTTHLRLCEKLQIEEPGCRPRDDHGVSSGELLEASHNRETSIDLTSSIRCTSSTTSPCRDKQGNSPDKSHGRAIVASSVTGEFSRTLIEYESAKSALLEGVRKSSLGKSSIGSQLTEKHLVIGASPCVVKDSRKLSQGPCSLSSPHRGATDKAAPSHRNILDVKPDVLADEMRTLSPGTRQRRILEITAHIKRRVDLQTLRDLTNNTLPYTSNEGKEIEENAKSAETLLSQLKRVITKADKREPTVNSILHLSRRHLSVTSESHRSNCVHNASKTIRVSRAKNTVSTQQNPAPKPSKSKALTVKPTINKRTFRKSTAVQKQESPARPSSEDLRKLGLPTIDEKDLEPVQTRKGTAIRLGSGDYGEVFLMRSRVDGTLMAVKRLTDIRGNNQKDKRTDEMLQEIRAMGAMGSCRVFPKFLGVLDMHSFAQEFVGNARTMISLSAFKLLYKSQRGPHLLPLDWVRICIDVTEGLEMLHSAGWTHNDLHVGNILVWRDPKKLTAIWEAKIIDLGKASPIKNPPPPKILTFMQMMFAFKNCTQMAPEIVEGRSRYNVKSDVYSLGIALQDIGKENRLLSSLKTIGDRCVVEEPGQRPELKIILKELYELCNTFINPIRRAGKGKGAR